MFITYVIVTLLTVAANSFAVIAEFIRADWVLATMTRVGVPHRWLVPLGVVKAIGALGLLIGFVVPMIGVAAAIGLVLFFVCAIPTHLRVRDFAHVAYPAAFLLLALGSLVLRLTTL
jgi:DoxX-like family